MGIAIFHKQPADVVDFDVDFSEWMASNDVISMAVSTTDTGLTLGATVINPANSTVKQWVSGGSDGSTYKVSMTITTTGGRTKQAEFKVKVRDL